MVLRIALLSLLCTLASSSDLRGGASVVENVDQALLEPQQGHRRLQNNLQWKVTLTNLSYKQPFAPAFVVVHSTSAPKLYTLGVAASASFTLLAEEGSPAALVTEYTNTTGVLLAAGVGLRPLQPGESRDFSLETASGFPYISLATMAINTNDCFAGFKNIKPFDGLNLFSPGYDAGTEANDELCSHMPGDACTTNSTTKTDDAAAGEGFVHVHRGVHGIGDLDASQYDWRNPMLQIQISRA